MIGYIQTPEMINLFAHLPVKENQARKLNDMYRTSKKYVFTWKEYFWCAYMYISY
jgi:hypothetical protein